MSNIATVLSSTQFNAKYMILTKEGGLKKANWGQRAVIWLSSKAGCVSPYYNSATAGKVADLVKESTLTSASPTAKRQAQDNLLLLYAEFKKHSSTASHTNIKNAFARAQTALEVMQTRRDTRGVESLVLEMEPPVAHHVSNMEPPVAHYFSKLEERYLPQTKLHPEVEAIRVQLDEKYGYRPLKGQELHEVHVALSKLGLKQLVLEYGKERVLQLLGSRTALAIAKGEKLLNLNVRPQFAGESLLFELSNGKQVSDSREEVRQRGVGERNEALFAQMVQEYSPEAVDQAKKGLTFEHELNQKAVNPTDFNNACFDAQRGITLEGSQRRSEALEYLHQSAFSLDAASLLTGASSVESVKEQILFGFECVDEVQSVDWVRAIFAPEAATRLIGEALRLMEVRVDADDLPKIDGAGMRDLLEAEAEDFDDGRVVFDCNGAILEVVRAALYPSAHQAAS